MSPLQRIGLGLIIVLLPADFPAHPHPIWNFYDLLPPPLGWLLVLSGIQRLIRGSELDLGLTRAAAVVAGLVSIPMWFPQLNHYLVPLYNPGVSQSWQWFVALPAALFGYLLSKSVGDAAIAQDPPERGVAGWFGVLRWGFVAAALLPAIVYGANINRADVSMQLVIGLVYVALVVAVFTYHRRTWLGGPGPKVWANAEERAEASAARHQEWAEFKAERQKAREELRAKRAERKPDKREPDKAERPE